MQPGDRLGEALSARRPGRGPARRWALRCALLAVAAIAALLAWLATRGGPSSPPAPRIVATARLGEVAKALGQPVYWVGPILGAELTLTELHGGGVQVGYLPRGLAPSDLAALSLAIGSYPLPDPAAALAALARRPGSVMRRGHDGRPVVTSRRDPTSVYFVPAGNSVEVEVYASSPRQAMGLALSGRVRPVT